MMSFLDNESMLSPEWLAYVESLDSGKCKKGDKGI
jgi:hypothetical protein